MKRPGIHLPALIAFPALFSCSAIPKEIVGIYRAPNGEGIHIEKSGSASWSPAAKSEERHYFAVIQGPVEPSKPVGLIVSSNTSSYLDLDLTFSAGYSRLTADWGDSPYAPKNRARQYEKQR